jgi:hypothetical protein
MKKLYAFLEQLEEAGIFFTLQRIRESIMVNVVVPGERWEVEFFEDGHVVVERFVTAGDLLDEKALDSLFDKFAD